VLQPINEAYARPAALHFTGTHLIIQFK
jgi:hypothetical protein